ncbi:MAG: TIM barrel protein, partial [Spirochaetales bacterium]|nr:TIM barrel protein [Spirochaetales bacterium]
GSGKSRFVPGGMRWRNAYTQLVEVTKLVGKIAATYGIRVAIEPLNRAETNLINSLAEGAALEADVNMPNVGLIADSYHMWQEGEDMGRILTCAPFMHTHIAMKGTRAYPVEATDEVRQFFSLLKEAGYDGTMSIEGKSDDWKADSVKALEVMRGLC